MRLVQIQVASEQRFPVEMLLEVSRTHNRVTSMYQPLIWLPMIIVFSGAILTAFPFGNSIVDLEFSGSELWSMFEGAVDIPLTLPSFLVG